MRRIARCIRMLRAHIGGALGRRRSGQALYSTLGPMKDWRSHNI